MKHNAGFTILEMLIGIGIVAILATVSVGVYMNYQESAETLDALGTIRVLREEFTTRSETADGLVACDDRLVEPGGLDDPYMKLSVQPVMLDPADAAAGYGAGLVVSAEVDRDGPRGIAAANRLMEQVKTQGASVSDEVVTSSAVGFTVLLTSPGRAFCDATLAIAQAGSPDTGASSVTLSPAATTTGSASQASTVDPATGLVAPMGVGVGTDTGSRSRGGGELILTPAEAQQFADVAKANPQMRWCPPPGDDPNLRPPGGEIALGRQLAGLDPVNGVKRKVFNQYRPGSDCLLCGDIDSKEPCTDWDIMLGMTNKCPDTQPYCMNDFGFDPLTGDPVEYRRCVSEQDAYELWWRDTRGNGVPYCAAGAGPPTNGNFSDFGLPIPTQMCHFACYGDACNLDKDPAPGTLVGIDRDGNMVTTANQWECKDSTVDRLDTTRDANQRIFGDQSP